MHTVRQIFDAMDADVFIAIYVTAAFLLTVGIVCQLMQIAWTALHARIDRWWPLREESDDVVRYSDPARPRVVAGRSYTRGIDAARSHRRAEVSDHAAGQAVQSAADVGTQHEHLHQFAEGQLGPEEAA